MVFDRKVQLLHLAHPAENRWEWVEEKTMWAHMEQQNKTNLFSRVGLGVKTVLFTLRKTTEISLAAALSHKGRHYFITDINTDDPVLMTVTTADIQPVDCMVTREKEAEGSDKSSVMVPDAVLQFPACLTEKYVGYTQQEPMAQTTVTYVLVTPKPVELETNDLVAIAGRGNFRVQVAHLLDDHKNEYEITKVEDV
ncbi:MAG TPA: head-tail adaptor protein [Clostridiales bacterium]|nr:head-tail adaptor protein [Clostridiales bacterium]